MKKLFTLFVFTTILLSKGFAQHCDTLFNLQSVLDTPTLYYADTGQSPGYISGNNVYGDLAKAEGYAGAIGDTVTGAVFFFGVVTINPADSDTRVSVAIWDNTGTSYYGIAGSPGNIIDTASITLRQIAQEITDGINFQRFEGLVVNFKRRVALTTDTFYVGVILPTVLGDSIALYSNIVPPGPDGNGWESFADGTWGSYNDDWVFTGGSSGNFMGVEICAGPTGVSTPDNEMAIKIFPNPANDRLNLQWSADDEAEVSMYGIAGNLIRSFTFKGTALNTVDIHDLAAGAYIISVTDRQTNEQHSSLFTKL